jgi:hypothetical protein
MISTDLAAAAHRPVTKLLDRLDGLQERGPGQWLAKCPAHDDRNPSLSIRETSDRTMLLKCWSGCTAAEVVAAIGLELHDLFPRGEHTPRRFRDQHRLRAADALELLKREAMIVAVAAAALLDGTATEADFHRVAEAVERIHKIAGGTYGA